MADGGDRINGWISRFVDPAKDLLSDGAARFLPTLFSPSPLQAPPRGEVGSSAAAGNSNPDSCNTVEVDKRRDHSDGALADIEQLIKGKTFSTEEVDHLIEVLHSRAQTEETDGFQLASTPLQTPALQTETVATPVHIARAYMASRTSQPGYLTSSARLSSNPIVPKAPICWPGAVTQSQEGYSTLRNRKTRYGLHSFSRTPYLRTIYTKSKSTSATPAKEAPLVRGIHRSHFAKEFNTVHPHSSKLTRQILEHIDRPVTLFLYRRLVEVDKAC